MKVIKVCRNMLPYNNNNKYDNVNPV